MDNISKLLQEAKPLYLARKKNRTQIKVSSCILLAVFAFGFLLPNDNLTYDPSWEYGYYSISNGSIIEDMGLPVDDYGFLAVG